jgi:hypothetical protein
MRFIINILTFFSIVSLSAQTATNFNCKDCSGIEYELYSELDAGKVIVLCWVMPCSPCVGPSLTTYNVVQSYQSQYPDKVKMFLCDDYANTNCTALGNWASANNLHNTIRFSDARISMAHYGSDGMPKIVVIAGHERKVFYNANNSVNITELQNGIQSAISASMTGIDSRKETTMKIFPNPASETVYLQTDYPFQSNHKVLIFNLTGSKIHEIVPVQADNDGLTISIAGLESGVYFITIDGLTFLKIARLIVL